MVQAEVIGVNQDCILCSYQDACSQNFAYLYAGTPILRQLVESYLRGLNAEFELRNDLFRIALEQNRVIEKLRERLSEAERADIRISRERGAALLNASTLDAYEQTMQTQWFEYALRNDQFTSHFQPIVDGRSSTVFAHECLIRLFTHRPYGGAEIIETAISRGSIHLFDSYARRLSIRKAGPLFLQGTKLFINFMPSSIYDPAFCMASTMKEMSTTSLKPKDVVFEVVESDEVRDVKHLQKICEYYRKEGFGFALDDVGTGSSSLQMVCDLKPDYIKLDKSFISRISDSMYLGAVEKLGQFADRFGVKVIGEGVETRETMDALLGVGISLMQGYYFGKPAAQMTAAVSSISGDLTQISHQLGSPIAPSFLASEPVARD